MIKLYWHYQQKRIFKEVERQAIVQWGYDPKKSKGKDKKRMLAEKWNEDPMYGFPNDIEYLTPEQVSQKIAISVRFKERVLPEKRWDSERGDACLGKMGVVARRCSMNDKLWGLYKEAQRKGAALTFDHVKKMILIDIKRSKLYPPGWVDDTVDPPGWYIERLRDEGKLDDILREIDQVARS